MRKLSVEICLRSGFDLISKKILNKIESINMLEYLKKAEIRLISQILVGY